MNGVDLIQVARVGIQNKSAADIRMAVDAMETLIVHRRSACSSWSAGTATTRRWCSGYGSSASGWWGSEPEAERQPQVARRRARSTSTGARWSLRSSPPRVRPAAFTSVTAERLLIRALRSRARRRYRQRPEEQDAATGSVVRRVHNYGARSFGPSCAVLRSGSRSPSRADPTSPSSWSIPGPRVPARTRGPASYRSTGASSTTIPPRLTFVAGVSGRTLLPINY